MKTIAEYAEKGAEHAEILRSPRVLILRSLRGQMTMEYFLLLAAIALVTVIGVAVLNADSFNADALNRGIRASLERFFGSVVRSIAR